VAIDEQTLINFLWGNTLPDTANWYVGVYLAGSDPITSLSGAEDTSIARVAVGGMSWSADHLTNTDSILLGPSAGGSIDGWFITYGGTTMDVAWVAPFGVTLTMSPGEYLLFDPGSINLNMSNG